MPTVQDLLSWIAAANLGAVPPEATDEQVAHYQRCLDAALAQVEQSYPAPATLTDDWALAVIMHAAKLSRRPLTVDGAVALDDFGPIRHVPLDGDVRAMLEPYKVWRFA